MCWVLCCGPVLLVLKQLCDVGRHFPILQMQRVHNDENTTQNKRIHACVPSRAYLESNRVRILIVASGLQPTLGCSDRGETLGF